jgi:hypothetical protein
MQWKMKMEGKVMSKLGMGIKDYVGLIIHQQQQIVKELTWP